MKKKPYYITTPIYYPSGKLHIGHSYTTVAADACARLKRMQGFDVMFLTGTDEHGQKIQERAAEAGVTPQQFVDEIVAGIKDLWKLLNISNDRFIRTTDQIHVNAVKKIFKELYDKGEIYKSEYEGQYCTPCESFWTKTQLVDGKCPDCGREVKPAKEESYFFRLSNYQDRLEEHYRKHPDFISPQTRLNEMINNFIRPGLEDLCVSRTTFTWGIPVDFDPGHVVYVWVDALSNYITAMGYGSEDASDYDKYWPADVHLVGKEIVRFHTIIWPAMLMALGVPLPKRVYGHGWLLLDSGKMSKSKGNVIDPVVLCEKYGVDAIRYFLLREVPFGSDGVFSNEALINRINSDLANDLGNLLSRTVAMCEKYFDNKTPLEREGAEIDAVIAGTWEDASKNYLRLMEELQFSSALTELWRFISRANKYIDETTPWVLAKSPESMPRLGAVMYNLCESLRLIGVFLKPILPETAEKILDSLGVPQGYARELESTVSFGETLPYFNVSRTAPLFPRIDVEVELAAIAAASAAKAPAELEPAKPDFCPLREEITIDDFAKSDMRICKVLTCENVPKSDKLLKFTVDIGFDKRQVVSGIAKWYKPEELVGKTLVLVSNLKPAKIRGVESAGMLLSAEEPDGTIRLLMLPDTMLPGAILG